MSAIQPPFPLEHLTFARCFSLVDVPVLLILILSQVETYLNHLSLLKNLYQKELSFASRCQVIGWAQKLLFLLQPGQQKLDRDLFYHQKPCLYIFF